MKRFIALALVLCAANGCSAARYEAVDATGALVTLAQPAQRIVSLSPHATELIDAAGAGERLVAVTQACDVPARVATLPRVANAQGVNIEALIATKPDLVVVWPAGNRPQDIAQIRALNIPLFASSPDTLAHIADDIEKLGALSGTTKTARTAAEAVRARIRKLGHTAPSNRAATRVFYQLGPGLLYTLNDQHPVMEVISRCGGQNVFGQLPQAAPQVSIEAVLNAKPQLIVLADPENERIMREAWRANLAFPALRNTQFKTVDGRVLHRPTPRMLDAADALCRAIRDNN